MKHFVVGFAIDIACKKILLIRKNRPEFQKGKLNGVGGKIEKNDPDIHHAMAREFFEETGLKTLPRRWVEYTQLTIPKAISHYDEDVLIHFMHYTSDSIWKAKSMTDEQVELVSISALPRCTDLIDNLHWLIPMFLRDKHQYSIHQQL